MLELIMPLLGISITTETLVVIILVVGIILGALMIFQKLR